MSKKVKVGFIGSKTGKNYETSKSKSKSNLSLGKGECVFPFKYKDEIFSECMENLKGDLVCATEVDKDRKLKKYGYCQYDEFEIGALVKIHGLRTELLKKWNGRFARVRHRRLADARGSIRVLLIPEGIVQAFRPENLKIVDTPKKKKTKKNSIPSNSNRVPYESIDVSKPIYSEAPGLNAYLSQMKGKNAKHTKSASKNNVETDDFKSDKLYKEIGNIESCNGIFDLVIGNVQSGKTRVIISHSYKIIKSDMISIVIIRNFDADAIQLENRIHDFNALDIKLNPIIMSSNKRKQPDISKHNIIIVKANKTEIFNVINFIKKNSEKQYCLCIDEVDLFTGDTKKENTIKYLNCLFNERLCHILGLTATPMAVIMDIKKWGKFPNRIFKLDPPIEYVGLNAENNKRLVFHDVNPIKTGRKKNSVEYDKEYNNIKEIMDNCSDERKFCISLLLSETQNAKQEALITDIISRKNDEEDGGVTEWQGVVYNQKSVKLIPPIGRINQIKDGESNILDPSGSLYSNDEMKKWKNSSAIQIALQFLKEREKKKIIIVSGLMASRGISFVSCDYKYHLTDIYISSDTKYNSRTERIDLKGVYCEQLIQKLRLLGIYHDTDKLGKKCYEYTQASLPAECKLHIWATEELNAQIKSCYSQIKKYQDNLVKWTKSLIKEGKIIDNIETWDVILKQIKQNKSEAPKIKTAKRKIEKYAFWMEQTFDNIEYDDKTDGWRLKDGGYNESNECNLDGCSNPLKEVDEIIKTLKQKYSEYKEKTVHQLTLYIPITTKHSLYSLKSDPRLKEQSPIFKQIIDEDLTKLIKTKEFTGKKYAESRIRNRYFQLIEQKEGKFEESGNVYTFGKSKFKCPLYFRYGAPNSGTTNRYPGLIDINFLSDFKLTLGNGEHKIIKSDIKDGDIFWWQNLEGKVFVNIKSRKYHEKSHNNNTIRYLQSRKNNSKVNTTECASLNPKPSPRPRPSRPPKSKKKECSEITDIVECKPPYCVWNDETSTCSKDYVPANPKIKQLFNEKILPTIIRMYIKMNPELELNFILCDNELNTTKTLTKILSPDELEHINVYIIEYEQSSYLKQRQMIDEQYINGVKSINILPGSFDEGIKEIDKKHNGTLINKLLYPDTSGNDLEFGGWPKYHFDLINEQNHSAPIILGTFPVHNPFPWSHFGREIEDRVTAMYEYGCKKSRNCTTMKTYISIDKSVFDSLGGEKSVNYFDKEQIIEDIIPGYKEMEKITEKGKR